MDFLKYLQDSKLGIEEELNKSLAAWRIEVSQISKKLLPLVDLFIDSCQGGKRLRGTLVRLGYELTNPSANSQDLHKLLKLSAAFEIFQTAILAHDDVIDKSLLRRGKSTLFRALGGDHYGISQAISFGDIGLFLATKLIADADFPADKKNKALSFFTQTIINTGLGEVLDVELPHLKTTPKEADIITIFKLKTAQYTITGPMKLGAILAGAKSDQSDQLDQFGENLGIAFQIQDDILGIFGNEATIGKSVTSDIEEGKNTILLTQALKKANKDQLAKLKKLYGNGKISSTDVEEIRKIFKDSGALDYCREMAVKYVDRAKKIIPELTKQQKKQKLLLGMANFLIKRDW